MTSRFSQMAVVTLTAVVLLGVPRPLAALDMPDTPAGGYVARMLAALNSGDEERWRAFILTDQKAADSADVLERRLEVFQFIYGEMGGLKVHSIVESADFEIQVLAQGIENRGPFEWIKLVMQLDTLPPHGWAGLALRPASDPNEVLPKGELTPRIIGEFLNEEIAKLVALDRFSGAVLVAKDGEPIFQCAVGEACKRYGIANRIDTKFNLGSMNKMFTGVAIAQLAEKGRLSFDDYVGEHLPKYPNADVREKVKIHHLLTHTSGLGDYWEPLFDSRWWEIRTVQQLADLFAEKPLEFEPGEKFQYSNAGPIVLGLIIEKVSGQSYFDYVRENIAGPAGMENTDCYEVDLPVANLAIGYTKTDCEGGRTDAWRSNLFLHAVKGGPAGGGYSTVIDLLKFDRALRGGMLLTKEYFDIVTKGKEEMAPDFKYGYLFGDREVNGQRIVGHNGGAPGISAVLDMYLDSGYTVAVLANYDGAAMTVADKLERLLTQ